jgi:large subunit ribosomal protein L10
MAQKYKVEKVETLKEELKDYNSFIFTDYRGLDVQQINQLRNSLRDKGAHYHVIKNRYAKRVFQDLGFDGMDQYLVNPTAIAYFEKNLSEIAKVLIDSAEETTLELKGGYSDGSVISSDELIKISKLPSRDVLLAQLLGMLNAPQRGLVTALHGILSKFVRTLKAVQEAKPAEGAEPKVEAEAGVEEEVKAEVKKEAKPKAEAKAEVKKEAKPKAEAKTKETKAEPKENKA